MLTNERTKSNQVTFAPTDFPKTPCNVDATKRTFPPDDLQTDKAFPSLSKIGLMPQIYWLLLKLPTHSPQSRHMVASKIVVCDQLAPLMV